MKRYRINSGSQKYRRILRQDAAGGVVTEEALLAKWNKAEVRRIISAGFLTEIPGEDDDACVVMVDQTPCEMLGARDTTDTSKVGLDMLDE